MSDQTDAPQGVAEAEPVANPDTSSDAGPEQSQSSEAETTTEDAPAAAETASEDKPAAEESDTKPKAEKPWFMKRIETLRSQKEALQAALDAASRQQQPQGDAADQEQKSQGLTEAEVERRAAVRAAELTSQVEFNRASNEIYEAGTKSFPDFDASISTLRMMDGLTPALIEAAHEAGNAHQILYQLGKDPDEAARILNLSPVRMAAAVAKLANRQPPAPGPISRAPAPIKPIGGSSKVEVDPDKMPMSEWVKRHPLPSR